MNPTVAAWIAWLPWLILAVLIIVGIGYAKRQGLLPANPFRLRGYEKFWLALLSGGSQVVPITMTVLLVGWAMKLPDYLPEQAAILSAITVFWTALWSALGALLGFNTEPTDPPPNKPTAPVPAPVPAAPPPTSRPVPDFWPEGTQQPAPPKTITEVGASALTPAGVAALPEWQTDSAYEAGTLVRFEGRVYRAGIDHTSQASDTPGGDPAGLWERVTV